MSNIVVITFTPITKFSPHIPLQLLSISVVRCCRVTTCLLCAILPSLCPIPYIMCPNHNVPQSPSPSLSTLPPHPLPFGNRQSLLGVCGSAALLFLQFLLCCYAPQMSEIIWYLSFSPWLISLSIIPSSSIHIGTNGKICLHLVQECEGLHTTKKTLDQSQV